MRRLKNSAPRARFAVWTGVVFGLFVICIFRVLCFWTVFILFEGKTIDLLKREKSIELEALRLSGDRPAYFPETSVSVQQMFSWRYREQSNFFKGQWNFNNASFLAQV